MIEVFSWFFDTIIPIEYTITIFYVVIDSFIGASFLI